MTTTQGTDAAALYAAILAQPDEDTPRLMYADWLLEHGDEADRDRAEFIRVQMELETPWPMTSPHSDGPICTCERCQLRTRERELLACHEAAWRRVGACGMCTARGFVRDEAASGANAYATKPCPTCHGTGDAGGLTWPLTATTTADHEEFVTVATVARPPEVAFRRGFPHIVTVPRLADALVEVQSSEYICPECRKGGHRYCAAKLAPKTHRCDCQCRRNSAKRTLAPTPWLAAVLAHHPVAEVVALDRVPTVWSGDLSAMWEREMSELADLGYIYGASARLPAAVFDEMAALCQRESIGGSGGFYFVIGKHGSWRFPTPDLARTALARAIATFVRGGHL